MLALDRRAHDALGGLRQSGRRAACVPARRAGRRQPAASPALLRPRVLAHRARTISAAPDARRRSPSRRQHDAHLVADLERLREHLGIERWAALRRLVGLDAGARLCAKRIRDRCPGSCCAASSSRRPREIDWFMHGMRKVFPEAWRAFAGFLPPRERGDLLGNYYRRLTDPDPAVHLPAARAWDRYEGACSTLLPRAEASRGIEDDAAALAIARIEAHYFVHDGFLADGRAARATCARSATFPARSCRDATTSSARRSPPTRWRAHGPRPSTSSCPTPGTRCASRASRASSCSRSSRMQDRVREPSRLRPARHRFGARRRPSNAEARRSSADRTALIGAPCRIPTRRSRRRSPSRLAVAAPFGAVRAAVEARDVERQRLASRRAASGARRCAPIRQVGRRRAAFGIDSVIDAWCSMSSIGSIAHEIRRATIRIPLSTERASIAKSTRPPAARRDRSRARPRWTCANGRRCAEHADGKTGSRYAATVAAGSTR